MSYEVLLATGRDEGADADKRLDIALVYIDEGGVKQTSDFFERIGEKSNRGDAFENGQLDICTPITFTKNGQEIKTDKFVAIKIAFHDKDWQLDTVWVTNRETGKYLWKKSGLFFGSKAEDDRGTPGNPYELLLDDPIEETVAIQQCDNFKFTVLTQQGSDSGTNNHVFFKLFDNTGHASVTARNGRDGIIFDDFESGETNVLKDFPSQFGLLSNIISKVLIIKVGDDAWKPEYMEVEPSGLGLTAISKFDLAGNLPPNEPSLDTHHNWMQAPRKDM
ncbi:MAG: hypothetical protein AB8E82_08055 [Aureispira sp.]